MTGQEKVINYLINESNMCPHDFELEDKEGCKNCDCEECWIKALERETDD